MKTMHSALMLSCGLTPSNLTHSTGVPPKQLLIHLSLQEATKKGSSHHFKVTLALEEGKITTQASSTAGSAVGGGQTSGRTAGPTLSTKASKNNVLQVGKTAV